MTSERTNAWLHAANLDHPTCLPPALIAEIIQDTIPTNGVALQMCAGPGFCLDAAERTDRIAAIVELNPARCDAIMRRWQRQFGYEPTLEATGACFSERAAQRLAS